MELQHLQIDYITQPNQSVKERHLLVLGNDEQLNYFEIKEDIWIDYLKQLTKDGFINSSTKAQLTDAISTVKYHVKIK